ncbi:putative bifunctional diguanylate cyclase/phosphodiesterase [Allosphingosinicella deserti]|uniref:Diguanylate cyclase n=1 Tax=Allosphingosinicella deserti TaxID=2116704 RepID=A0A2P7QYL3_9SPHN|nr:EAL domain-containing protein [Sphingomonas deserti]PSJ43050.1 diguanylate cyclase [Sphingomonas deserti]
MQHSTISGASGRTILIVDDNPVNLSVVVDHLEDIGFEVAVALGGEEALKRAEFLRPDLILLDVMMPGIDGFETCRRLKETPDTGDIPVIFMTALADVSDKVKAFAAGGIDYVSKPFQVEELVARVNTHLALRSARQQLHARNTALQDEIDARRAVEQALVASESRYRRLFETSTDGILLVDCRSRAITDVNPAMGRMLGRLPDELIGRRLIDVPGFEKVNASGTAIDEIRHARYMNYGDWAVVPVGGAPIDVEVIGSFYQDVNSDIIQLNFRDVRERKEAEARIRYLAHHDALTGLPNRTLLADRLGVAIAHARRDGSKVGVLMLDLDHFKTINDSLGHHVGDELLEAVATRLRGCLRDSDTAARLGGDEFVIALSNVAQTMDAETVAEKVLAAIAEPFLVEGRSLHVGTSIGISFFPGDGEDAGALLQAADTAMYSAKESGRAGYKIFCKELSTAAQRWHTLSNDVHGASARGEFALHYQPQIAIESGVLTGVEALLRWHHPTEGLVSPALFIPLLEERGLIVDVGRWVLETACRQCAIWHAEGKPPIRIAVNLSAQQFYRGDIVGTVREALRLAGLDPQWLELELTESLTLDETETTLRIMQELKALGVTLSLDDFGTGWSSLSYLRRFPLDRIKIDRSFVRDLTTHSSTAAIVHSILSLARNLGLDCVAEGVETREQLSHLQRELCSEFQGFLYSEAVPAEDLSNLLRLLRSGGSLVVPGRERLLA